MAIGALGGLGTQGVLALRQQILERSENLKALAYAPAARAAPESGAGGFGAVMTDALAAVNRLQGTAQATTEAYERGDTHDIASVMLARQKASVAFEATLQARNRLLSAYRDVMNMPV